jgi:hypothetical protein
MRWTWAADGTSDKPRSFFEVASRFATVKPRLYFLICQLSTTIVLVPTTHLSLAQSISAFLAFPNTLHIHKLTLHMLNRGILTVITEAAIGHTPLKPEHKDFSNTLLDNYYQRYKV